VSIVRADLDLDRVAAIRRQIPALANRRPDVYAAADEPADHAPDPTPRLVAGRS
jgi:hypothetical protein